LGKDNNDSSERTSLPPELAALSGEEWADKYARLLAEFDNYRKRTQSQEKERSEAKKVAFMTELLGVVDNFERALATSQESPEILSEGMRAIDRQLRDLLAANGVEPIDAKGQPFDPHLHEAIAVREDDSCEPNTVCEVYQTGWRLGDDVLRHAKVVVSKAPMSASA
jgi:molecular chaperone GrpE